ncbi:MAG TPA: HlyD family efflux transporter periplasmic adaptor subunit [Thermoanaerobaculia bacterium]|nr:HlyD family efflux transporter periplasmic adaptor subunit [Thermoanaerobaculia bacterium]
MRSTFLLFAAVVFSGCFSGYSEAPADQELRVRRAAFRSDVVLSGELDAARGEGLAVPPLPSWQTAIKWIVEDGAAVKGGESVAELDNSQLTADLESKRQSLTQSLQELQQQEAQWAADLEQKTLEVEKKKADLEKAALNVALPRELVSMRQYEDHQKAMRRAETEHAKAVEILRSRRTGVDAERRNVTLRIEQARRAITRAEEGITALVLRAPRDGIVVVRDHPWEGRKLQAGDPVWVGFPIALLPDLSSIRVSAALADVDDGRIAAGMPATITLDGYPALQFSGRVTSISAVAQESRRMSLRRQFEVLVALDRLDCERMRPGLSARVVVHREAKPSALLAPRAAIDTSGKTTRARLANGKSIDVKLGSCNAQECIVVDGLEEGERLAPIVGGRRG